MNISKEDLIKSFQEEDETDSESISKKDAQESFSNEMTFDFGAIEQLSHQEHTRHLEEKKAKGRPRGSTIIPNKVKKEKLTFQVSKYQKIELTEKAKGSDRSLSDYIRYVIRGIKDRTKAVIMDRENMSDDDLKKVSITISISKEEYNRIAKYCTQKLNRKIADGVRYILKHPSRIHNNILLKEKV